MTDHDLLDVCGFAVTAVVMLVLVVLLAAATGSRWVAVTAGLLAFLVLAPESRR